MTVSTFPAWALAGAWQRVTQVHAVGETGDWASIYDHKVIIYRHGQVLQLVVVSPAVILRSAVAEDDSGWVTLRDLADLDPDQADEVHVVADPRGHVALVMKSAMKMAKEAARNGATPPSIAVDWEAQPDEAPQLIFPGMEARYIGFEAPGLKACAEVVPVGVPSWAGLFAANARLDGVDSMTLSSDVLAVLGRVPGEVHLDLPKKLAPIRCSWEAGELAPPVLGLFMPVRTIEEI